MHSKDLCISLNKLITRKLKFENMLWQHIQTCIHKHTALNRYLNLNQSFSAANKTIN